ncbi:hypothetical protein FB451DRAFT_1451096 [Mycena latifolia]|nr:hypothetical protein FB451DRAFT_1451096 [Mycena latifolia]
MSSSSSLPGTLGNIDIGLVLAIFLFGLETLQTFNYYRQFPQDALKLKILVAGIWSLELAHTASTCLAVYSMTVTFYGQPQHIEHPSFSFVLTLFFHSLLSAIVPTFFAFRVRVLLMRWPITILCCFLNLVRLLSNLALLGELWRDEEVVLVETKLAWVVITASAVGPVVDIIIAVSLCYALWRFKNPDFKRTSWLVDTIILWTHVGCSATGSLPRTPGPFLDLTSTTHSLFTALYLPALLGTLRNVPAKVSWIIFWLIQAKLLSNSLLASLNGRQRLRSRNDLQPNGSSHVVAFEAGVPTGNTGLVIHMERISEVTHGEMGTSHKRIHLPASGFEYPVNIGGVDSPPNLSQRSPLKPA